MYSARGKLRDFSTKDLNLARLAVNPIFISESNKKLFKSALSCIKDLKYQFIWTLHGNIFLQKNTSSPAVQVKSDQVFVDLRQPSSGHQQQETTAVKLFIIDPIEPIVNIFNLSSLVC